MPFLKRITINLTKKKKNWFRKMIQKQLTPTPERSTNKSMNTEDKTPVLKLNRTVTMSIHFYLQFLRRENRTFWVCPREGIGNNEKEGKNGQ